MSDIISTSGIVGQDNVTPLYDPDGRFQIWKLSEVFMGSNVSVGDKRYVPKIGDFVLDTDLVIWYEVTNLDGATLAPTLEEKTPIKSDGSFTDADLLLGVGPGTQSDTYRVYLDKSVNPHTLAVDARLTINGSAVSYGRIFRGADLTEEGNILSLVYDPAGNIIGNKIPLEKVVLPAGQNLATWCVPVCYTMQEPADGEVVTFVAYSDAGHVVSKRQLLIENTAFIRSPNAATKYIEGISLECPFLSSADPTLISLPQNVTLSGVNLIGVVRYSDGSKVKMPVDGTKFTLLGLDGYIATQVGHQSALVLRYQLSPGEISYGAQVGQIPHMSQTYRVVTAQEDGAYNVKLFGYPVWVDAVTGYTLRWFLYTANRDVVYDVTNLVDYSQTAGAFNGTLYGAKQTVVVGVNLQKVNGAYRNYRHVQTESVVLWGEGTLRTTNWSIFFDENQNPAFGVNNHADLTFVNYNLYKLSFALGETTKETWLDRIYYATKPLLDTLHEAAPPTPSHFRIRFGSFDLTFNIDQFADEQIVGNGLGDNQTLFIEFLLKTPDSDLQLSVAGLPIYQVNP